LSIESVKAGSVIGSWRVYKRI